MSVEVMSVVDAPVMVVLVTIPDGSSTLTSPTAAPGAAAGAGAVGAPRRTGGDRSGRGAVVPSRLEVTLTSGKSTVASCAPAELQPKTAMLASSAERR